MMLLSRYSDKNYSLYYNRMSRYEHFDEGQEEEVELRWEEEDEDEPVCVKDMIPKANPLMRKAEFKPINPHSHYPSPPLSLPHVLSLHHYHQDRNNMALIDQSVFTHQQLKQEVIHCLYPTSQPQQIHDLQTLAEFYGSRSPAYQKFPNCPQTPYFATYVLSLAKMGQQQCGGQSALASDRLHGGRGRVGVVFSSDFQSGNLFRAYQREAFEYDLILQNDINTRGNNQWFFFSVRNVPRGHTLRFNIVNMAKRHSLFSQGMRPSVFSLVRFEKRGVGWVREGSKVAYRPSNELRKETSSQPYYCLSFEYKFTHEGDVVYFSYSIPYTCSILNDYLSSKLALHAGRVKVKSVGQTVGGNDVMLLQISSPEVVQKKRSVWIMARQHPGETTASFMMEGMLDFLLSDSPLAQKLLEQFVFKVVAMLNIDGVVHGNTRAELVGCDPNRKWADPHRHHHPILYGLKRLIEKDNVAMLLDLHSHSRRLGTFFYANEAHPTSITRIFPLMVAKADSRFDWRANRFGGGSSLTARKVLADILQVPLVYTVESSFFGYQREGDFKIIPYQPSDYREMGASILTVFAQLPSQQREKPHEDHRLLLGTAEQLQAEDSLWKRASANQDAASEGGSDEDPGADEFSKQQLEMVIPKRKNTKHKKKRLSVKVSEAKPKKELRLEQPEPQPRPKRIDVESCKRAVIARCSLALKQTHLRFARKACVEMKNAAVQVQIEGQRTALGRSNANNVPQAKGLCVWGQKMEEELVINGCSVGLQVEMARTFLRNRNQMALSTESLSRRAPKRTARVGTIMLHNENNFLNRGDILHSALRMLNKR